MCEVSRLAATVRESSPCAVAGCTGGGTQRRECRAGRVALRCQLHDMQWLEQTSTVSTPDGVGTAAPRLLGLFAHPDDEVFCVGGTFAAAAAEGANTMVVSFTCGEAGQIRRAEIATRTTLGEVRSAELAAACIELGVGHSRCLDFADGHLPAIERSHLVHAAVEIIREHQPDCVYSFDQTGAYGHPDHVVMSEVSLEACALAGDPTAFPDAGRPHAPRELLHARFPQNDRLLLRVLVDWLSTRADRFQGTDEFTNALLMFADGSSMLGYASDHLSVQWFPKGSYIIEQGEPASSLYLLLAGAVDVVVEADDGSQSSIASVGIGEFIGEVAIATDHVRNAHCIAAENTACFVLSPTARNRHAPRGAAASTATGARADLTSAVSTRALAIDLDHDVSAHVGAKVSALAKHASQYAIAPGLFPDSMLQQLLGTEYFFRAWSAGQSG